MQKSSYEKKQQQLSNLKTSKNLQKLFQRFSTHFYLKQWNKDLNIFLEIESKTFMG